MKRRIVAVFLAVLVVSSACAEDTAEIEAARDATLRWISLVDGAQYGESWDTAAALFQTAVARDDWVRTVESVRAPLASLQSRNEVSARYRTSLPGAPDGEYVVFQFGASYENKTSALETITVVKQSDGSWHAAGYYIK